MAQEFYKEILFARISFILHLSRLIFRGNLIQKKKKKLKIFDTASIFNENE